MKGKEEEKDFRDRAITAGFLDTPKAIAHRKGTAKEKEEEIKEKEEESFGVPATTVGWPDIRRGIARLGAQGEASGRKGKKRQKRT